MDHHIALDVLERHKESHPLLERAAAGKEPTLDHALNAFRDYLMDNVSKTGPAQRNFGYYLKLLRRAREPAMFHEPSPLYEVLLENIPSHSTRLIKLASLSIPPQGMSAGDFDILKSALRQLYSTESFSAPKLMDLMETVRRFLKNEPIRR